MNSRHLRTLLAANLIGLVGALAAVSPAIAADAFPNREIRFIIPWNAGGSNDIMARAIQNIAAEDGIRIIVENVAGATGSIGMTKVANAEPDGYTVGMGTSSTLALIAQNLTPLRNEQFTPLVRASTDPLVLLVPSGSPYQTLDAFTAHVKKDDGKVTIGTPGTNNLNHIFSVMTGRSVGAEVVNVPYTGGSKVIADLAGKQIEAAVLKPSESKGQIDAGMVKPIGVFATERLKVYPDVPTFKEKGLDVFPYGPLKQMGYIVAPAGVSAPVRDRLIAIFSKAIQSPKFKELGEKSGFIVDDVRGDALKREIDDVQKSLNEVGKKVFVAEKK